MNMLKPGSYQLHSRDHCETVVDWCFLENYSYKVIKQPNIREKRQDGVFQGIGIINDFYVIDFVKKSGYYGAVAWDFVAPTDIANSNQGAVHIIDPTSKNSVEGIASLLKSLLPVLFLNCYSRNFVDQFDGGLLCFSRNSFVHKCLPVKERIIPLQLACYYLTIVFQFNQL